MNPWVALVTLLSLLFYVFTVVQVGRGRHRHGVVAPAMTGHPDFERLVRVQVNTLEWLVVYLPSLWLFAFYVEPRVAAAIGGVWIAGRVLYALSYTRDAAARGPGFGLQALAALALLVGALYGVGRALLAGG